MNRSHIKKIAVGVFVLIALAFFVYAIVDAWHQTDGKLPSVARLVAAGVLWCLGLSCGAYAWATMLGGNRLDHGAGMIVSQLAKYVPGGIWQASGQIGLAKTAGVPLSRGTTTFSVMALTQAIAGCTWAIVLAITWTDGSTVLRILCVVGALVSLVLLDRRWMVWLLHKIPRTREASASLVPPQRMILLAWGASIVTLAATSSGYVLLLGSFGKVTDPLWVMSAYTAAWTIGFLALPIPSGFGVREAVLVFILRDKYLESVLVATSVYHRLASVAAEGLMAAILSHRVRPRRNAAPSPEPD